MRIAAVPFMALVLLAAPARADFPAGVQAYDGGDYATAFREWIRDARSGSAEAQLAIAAMYQFGEGRPEDAAEAARWYRRAAEQGRSIAQANLGEMYMRGSGVARDAARAYMWLSLAARGGNRWAAEMRGAVGRRLTKSQMRRAKALLASRKSR